MHISCMIKLLQQQLCLERIKDKLHIMELVICSYRKEWNIETTSGIAVELQLKWQQQYLAAQW